MKKEKFYRLRKMMLNTMLVISLFGVWIGLPAFADIDAGRTCHTIYQS